MTGSMYAAFNNSVCLHHCYSTQIKTQPDQNGISRDSDVALWMDKLAFDGKTCLPTTCHFLLVTKEQHSEFDTFTETYPEATKRGYSIFPMTPLLSYWNKHEQLLAFNFNVQ